MDDTEQYFISVKDDYTSDEESEGEDERIRKVRSNNDDDDDDDDDDSNNKAHTRLIGEVAKITGRKRPLVVREVRVASTGSRKPLPADTLLKRLDNKFLHKETSRLSTLDKPAEKPAAKREKRSAGFEKLAEEVNKWDNVVHERRKAEQVTFPLRAVDVRVTTVDKISTPAIETELQKTVYSLLHGAKLVNDVKETEKERLMQRAMSLQEVRDKNKELWRAKQVRQQVERKTSRQNSTKSKKFHKILRREKLRKKKAELEELQKTDPEAALERLKELDDIRVEERMTLRHRKSKWAHMQGLRANRDKISMALLKENRAIHKELIHKVKQTDNKDEEAQKEEEERQNQLLDEDEQFTKDMQVMSSLRKEQQTLQQELNEKKDPSSSKTSAKSTKVEVDPTKFIQVKSRVVASMKADTMTRGDDGLDDDEEEEEDDSDEEAPEDVIKEAFADDYLIEEFKSAKKAAIDKDKPESFDFALPGWGQWGGNGLKMSRRKARKYRMKAPLPPPRKDSQIGNVIYNEKADIHENIRATMVSELPFPFVSVKDFEASVRAPIGRSFVPENVHRKLTASSVVTKTGTVIAPMDEDSLLKKKYQKPLKIQTDKNKTDKLPREIKNHKSRKFKGGKFEKKGGKLNHSSTETRKISQKQKGKKKSV